MSSIEWSFQKSGTSYELILVEYTCPGWKVIFESGYISQNLRDILEAEWYLAGSFYHPHLTDRQMRILDDIKIVSQKVIAAAADPDAAD